jgi:endonuclease G, mitochondrial
VNGYVFVDFSEEQKTDSKQKFQVLRAIVRPSDFDFLILEVKTDGMTPFPPPLKMRDKPFTFDRNASLDSGRPPKLGSKAPPIYMIGYPSNGLGEPKFKEREDKFFHGVYGIKRLSVGQLIEITSSSTEPNSDKELLCSYGALEGSSGSPVFDFETGEVIGLHYRGQHDDYTRAIPIWCIRDRLDQAV